MPRVYITNRSGHDFSPAGEFGELVYLSEGMINPFQVSKIYRQFAEVLKDSDSSDFILVTGLSIMNMIASAIMSRLHGRINLLQYFVEYNKYKSRSILIDELLNKKVGVK